MKITILPQGTLAIYEQIVNQLKNAVVTGELKAGEALPSIRALAADLGVSVITTKRAYEELEKEGLVRSVAGKGFYVCEYNADYLKEKQLVLLEKRLNEVIEEAKQAGLAKEDFVEMVQQVIGEFEEKFEERNLTMVVHFDEEEAIICADGRRLWRVLENVFGNASKYAMENTRVYVDVKVDRPNVQLSLKNISAQPLNISADELTERFIRGDVSRNTEGSGLGLSIAKDLVWLQGGEFKLYLDGDLFKVTIEFKMK